MHRRRAAPLVLLCAEKPARKLLGVVVSVWACVGSRCVAQRGLQRCGGGVVREQPGDATLQLLQWCLSYLWLLIFLSNMMYSNFSHTKEQRVPQHLIYYRNQAMEA